MLERTHPAQFLSVKKRVWELYVQNRIDAAHTAACKLASSTVVPAAERTLDIVRLTRWLQRRRGRGSGIGFWQRRQVCRKDQARQTSKNTNSGHRRWRGKCASARWIWRRSANCSTLVLTTPTFTEATTGNDKTMPSLVIKANAHRLAGTAGRHHGL